MTVERESASAADDAISVWRCGTEVSGLPVHGESSVGGITVW